MLGGAPLAFIETDLEWHKVIGVLPIVFKVRKLLHAKKLCDAFNNVIVYYFHHINQINKSSNHILQTKDLKICVLTKQGGSHEISSIQDISASTGSILTIFQENILSLEKIATTANLNIP